MAKRRLENPKGHPSRVSKAVTKEHRHMTPSMSNVQERQNHRDRKQISGFQELGEMGKERRVQGFFLGKDVLKKPPTLLKSIIYNFICQLYILQLKKTHCGEGCTAL